MSLKYKLMKLGKQEPHLRGHIESIFEHLTGGDIKEASRQKEGRRIKDVLSGESIFGLNPLAARKMNKVFQQAGLRPYVATIDFDEPRKGEFYCAASFSNDELDDEKIDQYAKLIVEELEQLGWRKLEGEGWRSEVTDSAQILIVQRT